MKKLLIFISLFLFFFYSLNAQQSVNVYPTHWWVGMKNPALQLMFYGKGIGSDKNITLNYPGVSLQKVWRVENKNYLFVDIYISKTAKPGKLQFKLQGIDTIDMNSLTDSEELEIYWQDNLFLLSN